MVLTESGARPRRDRACEAMRKSCAQTVEPPEQLLAGHLWQLASVVEVRRSSRASLARRDGADLNRSNGSSSGTEAGFDAPASVIVQSGDQSRPRCQTWHCSCETLLPSVEAERDERSTRQQGAALDKEQIHKERNVMNRTSIASRPLVSVSPFGRSVDTGPRQPT